MTEDQGTSAPRASLQNITSRDYGALLFDMDGTILTSIKAAERVWTLWATRHGLDVAAFLPTIHGVKTVETIRKLGLPGVDAEAEARAITQAEIDDVEGIEPIGGAARFLKSLPAKRWAIVTSATRPLALRRIEAAGMPVPDLLISADDVRRGKPAPDCFLLAAQQLGQDPRDCLIFEDAPSGIAAAEAAGGTVVVVTAAHAHRLSTRHPTLDSFDGLSVQSRPRGQLSLAVVHTH